MGTEVKISFSDVEQTLNEMESSGQALESIHVMIADDNQLDMADKLNTINQALDDVIVSYQSLLLNNKEATIRSVQTMQKTDEKAADAIQFSD